MRDLCAQALETAKLRGATYADIRIISLKTEGLGVRNGSVCQLDLGETVGFGVRVIAEGAWGFASSSTVTREEVQRIAAQAVEIAKASATAMIDPVRLADEPQHDDIWHTPRVVDPFAVGLEDKLGLLFAVDETLREKPEIKATSVTMSFRKERQWLMTSAGTFIDQELLRSGAGYNCTAVSADDMQTRSYPLSFGGQYKSMGYELVGALDLLSHAERVREEAIALLTAPVLPPKKTTLVLGRGQMHLQIHESVGHATELDRVLGLEENYAGSSFATIDKLTGGFRYGSEIVNLIADGSVPTGLATQGYDDDGVPAQRYAIVKGGILKGYMTSREFCQQAGFTRSFGCNRAQDFASIPIVRINNLSLMPGTWAFDDLIADTEDGVYMDMNKSWSIDQRRLNFQFGCEVAYEIKGGKLGTLYKNGNYQGITPEFWGSCDAICGADDWDLMGVPNCGKGEPAQTAEMSHGCAPTRFQNVQVGVRA